MALVASVAFQLEQEVNGQLVVLEDLRKVHYL
jgi:hypothetical protein